MMQRVIVSPHHDDAVFSLAETMFTLDSTGDSWTIVTPYGGCREDHPTHPAKMGTLVNEHRKVCEIAGVHHAEGPFVDDGVALHPTSDEDMADWLRPWFAVADEMWIPLGIQHPDHVTTRDACWLLLGEYVQSSVVVYEELPYRVLYPSITLDLIERTLAAWTLEPVAHRNALPFKRPCVEAYDSQFGGDVERCCFVPERAWRLT